MIVSLFKKIFGTRNDRLLRQYRKVVVKVNAFEPEIQALSDETLKAKTDGNWFRFPSGKTVSV